MPFRETHHISGAAVKLAEDRGCELSKLSVADLAGINPLFTDDVKQARLCPLLLLFTMSSCDDRMAACIITPFSKCTSADMLASLRSSGSSRGRVTGFHDVLRSGTSIAQQRCGILRVALPSALFSSRWINSSITLPISIRRQKACRQGLPTKRCHCAHSAYLLVSAEVLMLLSCLKSRVSANCLASPRTVTPDSVKGLQASIICCI